MLALRPEDETIALAASMSAPEKSGFQPDELELLRLQIAELKTQLSARSQSERQILLQSTLVLDIGVAIARRGSLQAILTACCEAVVKDLGAAFARVWTLNSEGSVLDLQASAGLYTHVDGAHGHVPVGTLKIGRIAQARRPHLTNDVQNDPEVSDREWAKREGMVAFAGHPLMIEDRLVGVMAVFSRAELSQSTLNLLAAVASIIAHGVDRKWLEGERDLLLEDTNRALKAAERSNEALQRFAAVASHDLQEPLRQVAGFSQMLNRFYKDKLDARGQEYTAFIVEGSLRMGRLIEGLLAYSQIEAMTTAPMETADTELALREALANLSVAIQESEADITRDALPTVRGNQLQLGQIFQNLLGNAIKYRSQARPRIHVSAVKDQMEWVFCVRDNGIGIAPEHCDTIFGAFARLHGSDYAGAGLGLAFCSKIIELHRGRLWVESEAGKGSRFMFTIPD